jgi:hypothetical protein
MRRLLVLLVVSFAVSLVSTASPAGAGLRRPSSEASTMGGYWLATGYGSGYAYGVPYLGSPEASGNDSCVNQGGPGVPRYSCVGLAVASNGKGYWLASAPSITNSATGATTYDGFGTSIGNTGTCPSGTGTEVTNLNAPIVGIASAPQGFWLVGADGGVFAMCGAPFYGSMAGIHLNKPIVGIASTGDGSGYWLVASDGGVFSFGDATFQGSMAGHPLNAGIVGMAGDGDGGYWLVASDGGVFAFGDAPYDGSEGGSHLNAPMVGIQPGGCSGGYWTIARDGGVFSFGGAPFLGSAAGQPLDSPIIGMASETVCSTVNSPVLPPSSLRP